MKQLNEKQTKAIDIIRQLLDSWKTSNELNSSSHATEIERAFLESGIDENEYEYIELCTLGLWQFIVELS